jgi:hypothetical protein
MSRTAPTVAFLALLALACGGASAFAGPLSWFSPELRQIETDRADCRKQLAKLPPAPAPHLTARLGWHSEYGTSEAKAEWVELDLGRSEALDAVVLIAPPPNGGVVGAGYGFPRRFYVELLGEGDDAARTLIADHTGADFPNPGLLPVVLPAGGRQAQKVRITATRLVGEKGRFFFALGEVMLLRGKENLGARIEQAGPLFVVGSSSIGTRPDWGRINLVDGHNTLGPPLGPRSSPSPGFCSNRWPETDKSHPAWVEIDLGEEVSVDEVRLFPARPARYSHASGYGFPVRWEITLRGDDTVAPRVVPMPESGRYFALPGDNVVTVPCGGRARYVRLNVLDPHVSNGSAIFALAEMQVWSGGRNRALGASVKAADTTDDGGWTKGALVDGFASEANILDWPEWLAGLSQRREMEHRIATFDARQEQILTRYQTMGWWSFAALIATALVAFTGLNVRRRRITGRNSKDSASASRRICMTTLAAASAASPSSPRTSSSMTGTPARISPRSKPSPTRPRTPCATSRASCKATATAPMTSPCSSVTPRNVCCAVCPTTSTSMNRPGPGTSASNGSAISCSSSRKRCTTSRATPRPPKSPSGSLRPPTRSG